MPRGRKPIEEITDKQKEVLKLIISLTEKNGYQPSRDELALIIGTTRHAVTQRVWQLEKKGYLEKPPQGGERCLRIPGISFRAVRNKQEIPEMNRGVVKEIVGGMK